MANDEPKGNGNGRRALADLIVTGAQRGPLRLGCYGNAGTGKSTFASCFDKPVYLCAEQGVEELNVARLPEPQTWDHVLRLVQEMIDEPLPYKTLVIDTLDWLEPLIVQHICARDHGKSPATSNKAMKLIVEGKPNLDGYGYGHGWEVALEEWRVFVRLLETLRKRRKMNIVLLSHVGTEKIKNYEGNDYGVIAPAISKLATGLLMEWLDGFLYVAFETRTVDAGDDKNKRAKVTSTGRRIMYTENHGPYRAKNRWSLPSEMDFNYYDFITLVDRNTQERGGILKAELAAIADRLHDAAAVTTIRRWLTTVGNDVDELTNGLARAKGLLVAQLTAELNAKLATSLSVLDAHKAAATKTWLEAGKRSVAELDKAHERIAELLVAGSAAKPLVAELHAEEPLTERYPLKVRGEQTAS